MKSSLITAISILFLATGCSVGNNDIIEGTTDSEIASCKLAKEYMIFQGRDITDFDQIECVFLDEYYTDKPTFGINIVPTSKHLKYEEYLDLVEEKGEDSDYLKYVIYVDPELNGLRDTKISNHRPDSLFIKDGDEF